MNRDFVAIASELQPLTSLGVYHCGKLPQGGQALPKGSPFAPSPQSQEILLGYFGKSASHPTHVLAVNLNYKEAVTTTLVGPGPMQIFHTPTGKWQDVSKSGSVKLDLLPGGGALVRLSSK
jgi:hypothetical protein